jgi:hypothetical protein
LIEADEEADEKELVEERAPAESAAADRGSAGALHAVTAQSATTLLRPERRRRL